MKCIIENCKRVQRTRGLCATCYQLARRLVTSKQATWVQLEEAGLVLPPGLQAPGSAPFTAAWKKSKKK